MQFTGLPFEQIAWMAGAAGAAITILYLLKLRKRRVQVPFSPLWGRVLQEYRQQSDWWRRLRRILSWLIHLALAAIIGFALADPHPETEMIQGRHIVLLIDSSASMGATDVSGGANRLDIAKQQAEKILETMGAEDRIMLVNFNEQTQPLSPFVAEASLLKQPLRALKVVATGTRFTEAMEFAATSLQGKKHGELILLSDGAGFDNETLKALKLDETTTVRHLKVGEAAGNLAVTAFSVRRYLSNKLDYELFVGVQSFFDRKIEAELQLLADGKLVDARPVTLEPRGLLQEFFPSQAVSGERLEARIKVTSQDARDVMPLDDRAYALLPEQQPAAALLVTRGNLFLEGTLVFNDNVRYKSITPEEFEQRVAAMKPKTPEELEKADAFDLAKVNVIFFDRFVPTKLPKRGNFVYVDPSGENSPWKVTANLKEPIITSYRKSHPLMRWIAMRDVNINVASKFKLERGDTTVATSFGVPMIVTRDKGPQRFIGIAFDIRASDLPLRVAFPVLIMNIIDYFQLDEQSYIQNFTTGTTWSVKVEDERGEAQVTGPDTSKAKAPIYNGRAMIYGDQVGFYDIKSPGDEKTVAANLSNVKESEIAPVALELPEKEVSQSTERLFFDRKEYWIWAVLAVLALLLVEWWTYNRRLTV